MGGQHELLIEWVHDPTVNLVNGIQAIEDIVSRSLSHSLAHKITYVHNEWKTGSNPLRYAPFGYRSLRSLLKPYRCIHATTSLKKNK